MKNKKVILIMASVLTVVVTTLIIALVINNSNNRPDIISINGHKVSYYDKFTVGDNLYDSIKVVDIKGSSEISNENRIIITTNSKIVSNSIHICDSRIKTYKGITVGDNVSKINENFKFASNKTKRYEVKFKGNKEINNMSDYGNNEDSIFYITYYYNDNDIITHISMFEVPIKE